MRFTTIWDLTFPLPLKERLKRTRDWAALEVALKLPLRVKYWCAINMIGRATMKSPNVPASTVDYVLDNLPRPKVVA